MRREAAYDDVHHAQQHFRSILDSLARPGTIQPLDPVVLTPTSHLNSASVLVAFALLNADVSFHLVDMHDEDAAYLTANTRADAGPIEDAAFVFVGGAAPADALEGASCGSLLYPDTSATLVIQVDALSDRPLPGGVKLTLQGPGVADRAVVCAHGLSPDLLLALQARNAEFPLGLDAIVTCDDGGSGAPRVVGIPRTSRLSWESC